jgi:hypothetical protein
MKLKYLLFAALFPIFIFSQQTPLQQNNYERLTSYDELAGFIELLDNSSDILSTEVAGRSVEGRNIYAMFFSTHKTMEVTPKVKVLIFAQQHGNEHSGKEGSLLLASELIKEEYLYLFDRIELVLIPQMNPDGSEIDKRFNGNKNDLNRNHLILTEPETIALHKLFNKYLFEVTMDVHEYYPYSDRWKEFGFYKRADEQMGILTNLNVSEKIRAYSRERVLPYMKESLEAKGFSFNEYVVGGPPDKERLRHSTVDIDDGRQSLGIQAALSFILEGRNGRVSLSDIKKRAEGQKEAMISLLMHVYDNAGIIRQMVNDERTRLINSNRSVVLKMEHVDIGETLLLPLSLPEDGTDTLINVSNYHNVITNLQEILIPDGYLLPKSDPLLMEFIINHDIKTEEVVSEGYIFEEYMLGKTDTLILEETVKADISYVIHPLTIESISQNYLFIPTSQLKKYTIALAFEPHSMLGLLHYERFSYLIRDEKYPILRVTRSEAIKSIK